MIMAVCAVNPFMDVALAQTQVPVPVTSQEYAKSGATHHSNGEFDKAIADYTQAIQLDEQGALGQAALIYRLRGDAHRRKGNLTPAMSDYIKAVKIKPEFALELASAGSDRVPTLELDMAKPFFMTVQDVFFITERGIVAMGFVERGQMNVGDEVEILGERDTRRSKIILIDKDRNQSEAALAGNSNGVVLSSLERGSIERGQVLVKPGSITTHTDFEADVYLLTKEEGGRSTPVFPRYRPQFFFRSKDVSGMIAKFSDGAESATPGQSLKIEASLEKPVAIEEGLRFAIREGGRTVGMGIVTKVTK
jgi:translation elongation factor TU